MTVRFMMIEAEGETATATIEAALAVFVGKSIVSSGGRPAALPAPARIALPGPVRQKSRARHGNAPNKAGHSALAAVAPSDGDKSASIAPDAVAVDLTAGSESITYDGRSVEVTADMARFANLLARAMPSPCAREFLIAKLGIKGEWVEQSLNQRAGRLREALGIIGLTVKSVRGVGVMLAPAEG